MLSTIIAISLPTIPSIRNQRGFTYLKEGSPGTFILRGHPRTLIFGRGRHIGLEKITKRSEDIIGGSGRRRKRRMKKLGRFQGSGTRRVIGRRRRSLARRGTPHGWGRRGTHSWLSKSCVTTRKSSISYQYYQIHQIYAYPLFFKPFHPSKD